MSSWYAGEEKKEAEKKKIKRARSNNEEQG